MRRRIWLASAAIAAGSLAVGVAFAGAAPKASKPAKPKTVALTCGISLTTGAPKGSTTVQQPPTDGNQYGPIHCGRFFGGGIEADSFTVPDSGDTVGTYTQYFNAGTIHGTFDLVPDEGTTNNFTGQHWTGTVTITGGTGVYNGITGAGTLTCGTPDNVHVGCTETSTAKPKTALK